MPSIRLATSVKPCPWALSAGTWVSAPPDRGMRPVCPIMPFNYPKWRQGNSKELSGPGHDAGAGSCPGSLRRVDDDPGVTPPPQGSETTTTMLDS
jgi:hypothetical protein